MDIVDCIHTIVLGLCEIAALGWHGEVPFVALQSYSNQGHVWRVGMSEWGFCGDFMEKAQC